MIALFDSHCQDGPATDLVHLLEKPAEKAFADFAAAESSFYQRPPEGQTLESKRIRTKKATQELPLTSTCKYIRMTDKFCSHAFEAGLALLRNEALLEDLGVLPGVLTGKDLNHYTLKHLIDMPLPHTISLAHDEEGCLCSCI